MTMAFNVFTRERERERAKSHLCLLSRVLVQGVKSIEGRHLHPVDARTSSNQDLRTPQMPSILFSLMCPCPQSQERVEGGHLQPLFEAPHTSSNRKLLVCHQFPGTGGEPKLSIPQGVLKPDKLHRLEIQMWEHIRASNGLVDFPCITPSPILPGIIRQDVPPRWFFRQGVHPSQLETQFPLLSETHFLFYPGLGSLFTMQKLLTQ